MKTRMDVRLDANARRTLLAAAVAVALLMMILPVRLPLVRLVITLGVAWAAVNMGSGEEDGRREYSVGIGDDRQDGPVRSISCAFCGKAVDLTDSSLLPETLKIDAAFSRVAVRLPVDANITVRASGAFSLISMPGRRCVILGDETWHCGSQDPNAPRMEIRVSCAFGTVPFTMG